MRKKVYELLGRENLTAGLIVILGAGSYLIGILVGLPRGGTGETGQPIWLYQIVFVGVLLTASGLALTEYRSKKSALKEIEKWRERYKDQVLIQAAESVKAVLGSVVEIVTNDNTTRAAIYAKKPGTEVLSMVANEGDYTSSQIAARYITFEDVIGQAYGKPDKWVVVNWQQLTPQQMRDSFNLNGEKLDLVTERGSILAAQMQCDNLENSPAAIFVVESGLGVDESGFNKPEVIFPMQQAVTWTEQLLKNYSRLSETSCEGLLDNLESLYQI